MGITYSSEALAKILGPGIPIVAFSVSALIGSVILCLRTWQQYRMVHVLSIASAFSLFIPQVLIFVLAFTTVPETPPLTAVTMFFESIFPPLIWCLLIEIIYMAGQARVRFQTPAKSKKTGRSKLHIRFWTILLIAINAGLAIARGIGAYGDAGYTSMRLLEYFANIIFLIQLIVMLTVSSYHNDIRSFAASFYVVALFLTCVAAGSVTIGILTLVPHIGGDVSAYSPHGIFLTITIRLVGSIALLMIVLLFPTVWIRHIRQNQIKNDFIPAEPIYDDDLWNPEAPYDTNRQEFIQADQEQNYFSRR